MALIVSMVISVADRRSLTVGHDLWWLQALTLPIRYGGGVYVFFFPPDTAFALIRWPTLVANFVGAFLFFGVLTYVLLFWRRRPRRT